MKEIFAKRRQVYQVQQLKYLRYVFNDHFLLFILIALGALVVQYAQFLQHHSFNLYEKNVLILFVSVLTLLFGRLATFVEPADSIFLLAKEEELKKEFMEAVKRSLALPAVFGFVLILISAPCLRLYVWLYPVWLLVLVLLKAFILRSQALAYFKDGSLDWERAVNDEKERQARLLKLYALFTQVKGISAKAKRRKFLDIFLPRKAKTTYDYLYMRTYLRVGEYLGLTLRLLILAILGIAFIHSLLFTIIFVSILNYLLLFQLLALVKAYDYQPLVKIYPSKAKEANQALKNLIARVFLFLVFPIEFIVMLISQVSQANLSQQSLIYLCLFFVGTPVLAHLYTVYRLKTIKK